MKIETPFDTIAAVSTPPGEGGIGIVRISGSQSFPIIKKIFQARGKKNFGGELRSFTMRLGYIIDGERVIDEVLVSLMMKPHTYTREDVAEINCHGGAIAVNEVLRCVLAAGARLAEPGEFTKRAFINGRIDLAQAEAVLDIVRSKTNRSLDVALSQLKGILSGKIGELAGTLKGVLIELEASIDFAEEEDVSPPSIEEVGEKLTGVSRTLDRLIESYDTGKIYRDGVLTALVGKPNVGKSSILNAFMKFDRAIVTPIPGTTRDVIEEQLNIGGIPFILADTAGITESENLIEKEGVRRSLSVLERADLVILVLDGSLPADSRDVEIARSAVGRTCITVINKVDLPPLLDIDMFVKEGGDGFDSPGRSLSGHDFVRISAKTGAGLKDLERAMTEKVVGGHAGGDYSALVANSRHFNTLTAARKELAHALRTISGVTLSGATPYDGKSSGTVDTRPHTPEAELLAYDVRSALDHLGEITGEVSNAEILEAIFSSFCIGK